MLLFLYYNYFVIYYLKNLLLPKIIFSSFRITIIFFTFHYLSFLKSFVAIFPNFFFFSFRIAWSSKTFSNFYLLLIKGFHSLFQHRFFIRNHLKWNTSFTKEGFFLLFSSLLWEERPFDISFRKFLQLQRKFALNTYLTVNGTHFCTKLVSSFNKTM